MPNFFRPAGAAPSPARAGRGSWLTVGSFETDAGARRAAIAASYTIADDTLTRTLVMYAVLLSFGRGDAPLSKSEFGAIEDLVRLWYAAGIDGARATEMQRHRITNRFDVDVGNKLRRGLLMGTKPVLQVAYCAASVVGKGHRIKEMTRRVGESAWKEYELEFSHFLYGLNLGESMERAVARVRDGYPAMMPTAQFLGPALVMCGRLSNYETARETVISRRPEAGEAFYDTI